MGVTEGLTGSLPALVTPLTPEREVDAGDLELLIRLALDDGASGVVVAGSTGEGALLEPEQRAQLTRHARSVIDAERQGEDDRPVVVAGASGATVAALDVDVARLAEAGADLALVLAPHTYPLSSDELADLHLGVAERAAITNVIYHIPQLTGSALTPETVAQLAGHPDIVGMKDSSPDPERRATFLDATRSIPGFDVVTGHAPTLAAALRDGATGSITAIANVRQRQVVDLHAAVAAGDQATSERHQAGLSRTADALAAVGASMPATLKAALQLDGTIKERWCREPLRSVAPGGLDRVRTALLR